MERFSLGIFGTIQIHVGGSLGPFDLLKYEKRPDEEYKEYAIDENCSINSQTTPH